MVVSLVSVSLSFSPSTYVTSYVCWISPSSPSCLTTTSPGCRLGSTMVCVPKGTAFVRVSSPCVTRRTRRIVSPLSFSTLTRSSLFSVMPLESRMEAAGSLPFDDSELCPSAMTVTGPFWLMISPPVSLLYTLSILTVTFAASASFCSKNPISCSALVATVQKGTSCPLMVMVVW